MRPREHVILGSAASIGLYFLLGTEALHHIVYFWLASILIDIDHYLDYIYNNGFRDYSFKRMMTYHGILYNRRFEPGFINLSVFHTVEFMGALGILALYTGQTALIYIWWGFIFHIFFDTVKLIYDGSPSIRCNTIIGYFFRIKKLRMQGFDTKAIYTSTVTKVIGNYGS